MSRARAEAGNSTTSAAALETCPARGTLLFFNDQSPFLDVMFETVHPRTQAETGTTSGDRRLASSVPSVLVRSHGCSRTPPRPHGAHQRRSINTNEKEDNEKTTRPKPRTTQRRNEMKIKVTSLYVDDQDKA